MHRLHPPGDFCLKERINVNDSTDYFGAIGVGRVTHVAVQHRMGILSERRAGSRACDFAYSGTDGASLVRSSTDSLANLGKLITAGHTGQIAPTMRIRLHGRRELR